MLCRMMEAKEGGIRIPVTCRRGEDSGVGMDTVATCGKGRWESLPYFEGKVAGVQSGEGRREFLRRNPGQKIRTEIVLAD